MDVKEGNWTDLNGIPKSKVLKGKMEKVHDPER